MEIFIIFILLFGFIFGADEVLQLDQGKLTGSILRSRNGREFKAFQGIPYAKSPTGDLRFKIPKKGNRELLLPVMIRIPGGGYFSGSGGLSSNGPHYLLDKDIVIVTLNYRLGILGFLSTENDDLPGNYGMKDQVLALKWVQKNIDKFDGDPKKVTLFGQSAGSVSIGLHLLSPMSKGLFHKAIMESGSPLNLWGVSPPGWAKRRTSAITTIVGCPKDPKQMIKCLKEVPAKVLVNLYNSLFTNMEIFIICTLLFGFVFGADDVLELSQGKLTGSSLKTRNGREFKAFQGIPYAKPPTGDLRFQDPVPADPWIGILNATTEPQVCIQRNLFYYQQADILTGSEDCLYLNVYTPKIPKKGDRKLLPVMFWIPGGGYFAGSGGLSLYGPQYLLDKDIVLVSINYRLGIIGFLSTENDDLPGNYGMKDQVLALKWVKNNIDKFGGNRKKVTIFGESAGSASVGLHLLSPMSKGLFHKAIMKSTTPLNLWSVTPPGYAKRRAAAVSTIVGCPVNTKDMIKCLKEVPAKVLVNIYNNLFEWRIYPIINFMPVAENCNRKKESFLCKYPLLDFKQISKVPVLMGMNSQEGSLFASRMYNATDLVYTELKNDFDHYVSSFLEYRYTTKYSDISVIGDRVFERYFPDGTLNDPLNTVKMITGGLFIHGIFKMAVELSRPVYYYIYDHLNYISFNSVYGPYPFPKKLGVTHADEITSLFYTVERGDLQGEDLSVSNLMVNIWTNFASTDTITIDGTKKGEKWPKFNTKKYEYVLINTSIPLIKEKPYVDEYEFWNSLPLLSGLKESRASDRTEL